MKFETVTLPVRALEVSKQTRVRKQAPQSGSDIVIEYAEAYRAGLILEPLDVFREKGTERYIVADGEHRLLALTREKIAKVECRLYEGDEVDALEFATRCNQKHGLRRTKADIYHAFTRIKETPRLAGRYRTDTELAYQLGISIATVKRYQIEWRDSEGGDARVQEKKKAAKERAKKHTSAEAGNGSVSRSQVPEEPKENTASTRIEAPAKALQATPGKAVSTAVWTATDQAEFDALCDAWKCAGAAARKRFQTQVL